MVSPALLVKRYMLTPESSQIKEDADAFHGKTWPDIVGLASQVYEYAQDAGRKTESSYYANMLDWVRQYHDELKKETPDQDTIKDLKDAITDITKKQIRSIDKLQGDSKQAKQNLMEFEKNLSKSSCLSRGYQKRHEKSARWGGR